MGTSSYTSDTKNYSSVSDIETYNHLDEEAKYRLLDDFSNSISKRGTTMSNYSVNKRKVYIFNNYVTASQKREEVLKFGIQD